MSWTSPPPYPLFNIDTTSNSTTIDADEHSSSSSHSSSSPFQNLKPSILVIILILSITLLVSLSLCLLLRLLNRRCLRHLSPSSTSSSTTHLHSSVRVSPHVSDSSPSVLDSLPLFTFGSIKRRSSAADCAVCLSKFESHDQLRLLPLCCHAFHASCIDTWLLSNQTCPLCRSPIHASDSDLIKALSSANTGDDSFRLEIGSVSRRRTASDFAADHAPRSSYSIGSFEYVVEEESEINMSHTHRRSVSDKDISGALAAEEPVALATEVASGRSWLKDYVDRLSASLSSRSLSFRSSGRFMGGSCRRSEVSSPGDYDLEASRAGEEISEFFRWFSGV